MHISDYSFLERLPTPLSHSYHGRGMVPWRCRGEDADGVREGKREAPTPPPNHPLPLPPRTSLAYLTVIYPIRWRGTGTWPEVGARGGWAVGWGPRACPPSSHPRTAWASRPQWDHHRH